MCNQFLTTYDRSCLYYQTVGNEDNVKRQSCIKMAAKFIIFLSVQIIVDLSRAQSTGKQFKKVTVNSTDLCAVDRSSSVLTILPDQPVGNRACVHPKVLCAGSCSKNSKCIGYNYKDDSNRCEMYDTIPISCATQTGCSYFQVSCVTALEI